MFNDIVPISGTAGTTGTAESMPSTSCLLFLMSLSFLQRWAGD